MRADSVVRLTRSPASCTSAGIRRAVGAVRALVEADDLGIQILAGGCRRIGRRSRRRRAQCRCTDSPRASRSRCVWWAGPSDGRHHYPWTEATRENPLNTPVFERLLTVARGGHQVRPETSMGFGATHARI
jgi:hypothetical protein